MSESTASITERVECFTREELQALKAKALRLAISASVSSGALDELTALARAASVLERRIKLEAETAAMRAQEKERDG